MRSTLKGAIILRKKMTQWEQWTKPGKKKTQTDRKMIKTSRVYWKKKADIMGWWQKSITVVATSNGNKAGSSLPSCGTRIFMII